MKKKIYNNKLLLLFVLLFGVSLRPHVAQAAEPDSYVRGELNKYYRNYTDYYEVDGYVYYESYVGRSDRATHYENGLGRWNNAPYPTVNTLHSPGDVDGRRMLGQAQDWGFRGVNTVWDGPLQSTPNGVPSNRNVRYTRKVKVTYKRDKTTPATEGIDSPSSNVYVNGNNWWVKPNDQFQLTVKGYQNYNGFGKRLPLRDYVSSNYLSIVGEGQELRSQMYRDGGLNTFRTTSHFKVSRNTSSLTATDRRFNSRYNLTATQSGKKYDISTYAGSQNGKTHGYIDTGIDLRTDGVVPTDHGAKVFNARYVNGNDHWIRPGDKVVVEAQGYDYDSRLKQSNIRLFSSGHDNRGRHYWTLGQGTDQYQRTGDTTTITGGKVDYWGWTGRYHFDVSVNSNAGNRTINIATLHGDNVGHGTGWTTSDQRIRTDATAPTITANTTSRGWGNNVTVALTHADGQSGIATRQYAWSTSTSTPSSWSNYSSAVTQSSNGTWYLHARAVDNVGRVTTERFGPYRIDKTAPSGTISGNPTSWTNQNVTLTFNATDSGGSGVRRVRQSGGSWVNGSTTSRTVSSNGTYSFEVEDNAGNTRTVLATVTRIDKLGPNAKIESVTPEGWTNGNVTITVSGTDALSGVRRIKRPDGTYATGSVASQTVSTNGWHSFTVEDNAGNTISAPVNISNIDKALPNGTITGNPTSWTNQNVTLTFNATDTGGSGVRRVRIAGGTWVNGSTTTQTATANGTYRFEVEDHAGNTRTVAETVTRIDKTLPSGMITGNPTSWQNTNATLTFNGIDPSGSGVKRVRIAGGTWVNGATTSRTVSSNGTYSFEVEDNAGNTRTVSATVNRIDKTLPNGTITGNPTSWTNQNATLTFNATDTGGSGVKRVRIAGGSWVNGSTTSRTVSSNGTYSFEVEDNAGNTRTVSATVNRIDKTLPNASSTQSPTAWTNGNVNITWAASATGSPLQRVRTHNGSTWGAWSAVSGTTSSTVQTVTSNGTYHFQVQDAAGNVRQISHTVTNIDKTLPSDSMATIFGARYINGNDHWVRPGDTVRIYVDGYDDESLMRNTNLRLYGDGNDNRAEYRWYQRPTDVREYQTTGGYTSIYDGSEYYWDRSTVYDFGVRANTNAGNRTFNVYTYFTDNANNNTGWIDSGLNLRTDATAPTISANPTSRDWGNGSQTVTLTHADGQSGIATRQYAWSTSTSTPSSWTNYSSAVTQSTQGTWYLHARAVDNVGRVTTQRFGPYRIDKTAPNGTITGNPTSWQNTNATLTFNATDTGGSGVRRVRKPDGTWVNGATTSQSVASNGTYTFRVEDNAGNIRDVSVTVTRIDKALPNGTITGNPTSWQNTNATLTFNATDTGGSGVRRVRIAGGSWVNGSTTTQTATANGTYSFEVEDHAGNTRTVSATVNRIDKAVPNGTITGNPTSWQNTNATLTFNATDTGGSGVRRVRIAGGSWVNGSTTTQTATANGTYSFEVEDNAGNKRTVSVTVNRIDKTLPNASSTQSPTAWTNGNVNITWTASATGSPLRRIRTHNGSTWGAWSAVSGTTSSTVQTVTSNGTYHYQIEDQAGNVRQISHTVTNIDKTLPNMTFTSLNTDWTNKSIDMRTTVNDRGDTGDTQHISGVQRIRMRPQGGSWSAWRTFSSTSERSSSNLTETWTIPESGTYEWQLQDRAGNIRTASQTVSNIDYSIPTGSANHMSDWTNGNVWIDVTGRDTTSGLASIKYVSGGKVTGTTSYSFSGTTASQTVRFTATENGTYSFDVTDRAGNTRRVTRTVSNIDRTMPSATTAQNPTGWTNQNVTISLSGQDLNSQGSRISGVDRVRMRPVGASSWTETRTVSDSTETSPSFNTLNFTVSANDRYQFELRDRAGNIRLVEHTVSNIDRTAPHGSTTQTPTAWTNQDIVIRLAGGDTNNQGTRISGVNRVRMRPVGASSWSETRTISDSTESSPNFNPLSFTITENGRYQFELRDRAGNIRMVEHTVTNIDRLPPATSGSFVPDGWTNQTITITWLAERTGDPGAPLEAYRYDRGNGNWTSWQNATHSDAFTVAQQVTENGVYRFDIRDEAGNVARSSVTVSQHDIVLPTGDITARFDRSERDDHLDYTSNDLVNMVDSNRVTVDVTGVEDLGISGVDFVTIEEQKRIGYGGEWMTVGTTDYDWPDPYNTTSQTYDIDVTHAQDTRFILTVTDRAGNRSTRATSNVVRQSVLQAIDFRITDVVNPQLSEDELAEIRTSDLSEGVVELTAGTDVTFDVTYQLRHLDTVDELSGNIRIETISDDRTHTQDIEVKEDTTGHNQHVTFTKTFTVPQGTPKGSEITIVGNLEAKLANGTVHEISYPSTADLGVIDNHIEEFFRFRIVR